MLEFIIFIPNIHLLQAIVYLLDTQLSGQSDKEVADEYFVKNSEVRQAQVSFHALLPIRERCIIVCVP